MDGRYEVNIPWILGNQLNEKMKPKADKIFRPSLGKPGLTKFVLSRFSAQHISKRWNAFNNILNAFWNICNVPQRKYVQNVPYHWKIILRNSENGHVLLQLTRISRALFQKINYGENFLIFLISIQWMPTSMLSNLRPSLPVSVHTQNMTAASWHTENHVRIIEALNARFFNIFWGLALWVLNGIQADITMLKHRMDNKDRENQDPSCANVKCDWMTLT